jgi:phosphohistidine phosphatase
MKNLLLMRHAHTEKFAKTDIQRKLTEQGRAEAKVFGQKLNTHGVDWNLVFCSPAERAQETAQLMAHNIEFPENLIVTEPMLYHAGAMEIVSFIQNLDDDLESVIIIGHNPVMLEIINLLGKERTGQLKPCHAVKFRFAVDNWENIGFGTCADMMLI